MRVTAVAIVAAALLAGCGSGGGPLPTQPTPAQPQAPPEQIQVANGPIIIGPGPSPLAVKLNAPDVVQVPLAQNRPTTVPAAFASVANTTTQTICTNPQNTELSFNGLTWGYHCPSLKPTL